MQRMLQLLVEADQQMHVSVPLDLPGLVALSAAGRYLFVISWNSDASDSPLMAGMPCLSVPS